MSMTADDVNAYYDQSYPMELLGGGGPPPPEEVVPVLTSITPTTHVAGTGVPPIVTATGTGFTANATAQINAGSQGGPAQLTTTFVDDTTLTFSLWNNGTPGTSQVSVRNGITGTPSNALPYEWTAAAGDGTQQAAAAKPRRNGKGTT